MALQLSTRVRNARANQIETTIGASPILQIRTGAPPANCAAADSGTVLATLTLPSDWLTAAANGVVSLNGTWEDTSADGTGTAGHYRIYPPGSPSECDIQGNVGLAGSPTPDMTLDSLDFTAGQSFSITAYTLTEGNA